MLQEIDKKLDQAPFYRRAITACQQAFWSEYAQFPLWLVVFFAAGIVLYDTYFSALSLSSLIWGLFGLSFCAWQISFKKWHYLFWIFVLGAITCAGMVSMAWRMQTLQAPSISEKIGPVLVMGKIAAVTHLPNQDVRIRIEHPYIEDIKKPHRPDKIRLKIKSEFMQGEVLRQGHDIMVMTMLMPPSEPVIAGGFDFKRYAYFQKIGANGYAIDRVLIKSETSQSASFVSQIRTDLRYQIQTHITDPDHAAIAMALLLGEKKSISQDILQEIRIGGIAHLLAISGLHIGLIAAMFFVTIRQILVMTPYIGHYWPCKKIAFALSFLMVLFYVILVGAPISALRALVMVFLVMVALFMGRRALTLRLVSFTAFGLLIFVPEALFQASFQMSFAAVMGLIAFYEASYDWWQAQYQKTGWYHKIRLYLLGAFATTLIASLATAPVAMFHFQQVSLLNGLVLNLLAVPLVGFAILPLGVLAVLLSPFVVLSGWLFSVMGAGIDVLMTANHAVVLHGVDMHYVPAFSSVIYLCWMLAFTALCFWSGKMRYIAILPVICAIVIGTQQQKPDIYIAEQGKLWAIYMPAQKQLLFSHKRGNDFVRKQWLQHVGIAPDQPIETIPKFGGEHGFYCDDMACRLTRAGQTVSIMHMPYVLERECHDADLVLIPWHMRKQIKNLNCASELFLMKTTAEISLEGEKINIKNVNK